MGVISHCPEKHTTFIHPLSTSFLVSLVQLTDVFYQYRVWIIMVLCCASLHQMPLYAADDNSLIYEILTKQIWWSWSFFTKFPQFFLFTSLLNAVTSFCWIVYKQNDTYRYTVKHKGALWKIQACLWVYKYGQLPHTKMKRLHRGPSGPSQITNWGDFLTSLMTSLPVLYKRLVGELKPIGHSQLLCVL